MGLSYGTPGLRMLVPVMISVVITIVLVVFISPVALGVPGLGIGVPPPMTVAPAVLASFSEIVTGAIGFRTAIAVVLDSFVKPVVGAVNTFLAVVVISAEGGGCAETGKGREGCCDQGGFAEVVYPSMWQVHLLSLLVRTSLKRQGRVAG
jgi:hypothetical protein